MSKADPLSLVGTTIADKYAVETVVGEGGFAIVYRATHLIWKRPVAIKIFRSMTDFSEADREKLLQEFIQEGALLAELSERSASIVQARDVGTLTLPSGEWVPYMVLEWLEGATLEDILGHEKDSGMPLRSLPEAVRLLEPVAQALGLAHSKGIAHRDVKPGNIFVLGDARGDCTVKLLDFGIAKVVADAQKIAGAFNKTSGAVTSFTPAYGAPEQFSRTHGATGPWTDVFALALILTEVLTGNDVLDGHDFVQLAVSSSHPERRPSPRTLGVQVTDEVERVFLKAVTVSPKDRYQAAGEFWNELRGALGMEPMRAGRRSSSSLPDVSSSKRVVPAGTPSASVTDPRLGLAQTQLGSIPAPAPSGPGAAPTLPSTTSQGVSGKVVLALVGVGAVVVAGGVAMFAAGPPGKTKEMGPAPSAATSSAPAPSVAPSASASAATASGCPEGMIRIPGGKFYMGSDDKNDLDIERPAHQVTISPYCMDRFEVSTNAYKKCSDNGQCKRASTTNEWEGISAHEREVFDPLCNIRDPEGHGTHPINCVDWTLASQFCTENGKRLPTEAEWEFAARGPDGRKYPWGDEVPTGGHLNACGSECLAWGAKNNIPLEAMYKSDDGYPNTAPVGSFPSGASRYGVEDVVGNVWEWVADFYADYTPNPQSAPEGPDAGDYRVIRGGAWNGAKPAWVRPTFRYRDVPTKRSYGIGFRCAKGL